MQDLILSSCELTNNSLIIPQETSLEDWQQIGERLKEIEGAVMWWIGDWLNFGEAGYGETYSQALSDFDYEKGTLQNAKYVAGAIECSRRREVLTFGHHQAALGSDDPNAVLEWAEENGASVRELRSHIIKSKNLTRLAGELPDGVYRVIYADPPWKYGDSRQELRGYSAAVDHYPVMTIQQLCDMPVLSRVADDAVLFLWVTSPLLYEAEEVIKAWGFEYKASIVWDKVAHNVGHYVSVRHEFLLICTRGSCTPTTSTLYDSVVSIERAGHSEKPEYFRELIDSMYPYGSRLELFRRGDVPEGWEAWGNETITA